MAVSTIGIIGFSILQFFQTNVPVVQDPDWQLYKTLFVNEEGRVIDTGNQNNSHSEGQGWGMLFAVKYNDKKTFTRLWDWTQDNLKVRSDDLFAWRWLAEKGDLQNHVVDKNNATDGDLYIAWALLRAGQKWNKKKYSKAAKAILKQVRNNMIRKTAGMTVLLPGSEGFEFDDHLVLNLSYWIFPAFAEFNQLDPDPIWHELHNSGLELLAQAKFGQWNLPSDWIALYPNGDIQLTKDFPPRFSYDAIRVPLSLLWGEIAEPQLFKPYEELQAHFSNQQSAPAWINLEDNSTAPYQASDGFKAVVGFVNAVQSGLKYASDLHVNANQDYYSASLVMLTRQASEELNKK